MIIGLTGGIASGKSSAADELARLGARVIDADVIVHYLSSYDPAILASIRATFGDSVFTASGSLDRAAMSRIVFDDAQQRAKLEAILHPPVMAIIKANIAAARSANQDLIVVVPLLFEGGYESLFDEVWVVTVSPEIQIERLMARGGLSSERAISMIAAQQPLGDKELLADRVVDNNGGPAELFQALQNYWEALSGNHAP
ncbi:MAG: dephospho-CoA kinase [bacterium]|nr:dephospho-CoA kinase [bacterium]